MSERPILSREDDLAALSEFFAYFANWFDERVERSRALQSERSGPIEVVAFNSGELDSFRHSLKVAADRFLEHTLPPHLMHTHRPLAKPTPRLRVIEGGKTGHCKKARRPARTTRAKAFKHTEGGNQ